MVRPDVRQRRRRVVGPREIREQVGVEDRPAHREEGERAAVDEQEHRRRRRLETRRHRRDEQRRPGDGHDDEEAESERGGEGDDEGVEDEPLAEAREHRDDGRRRDDGDDEYLTDQREQRRPVRGERPADESVDAGGAERRDDGGDADEEDALPGVLAEEEQAAPRPHRLAGVERGDAGHGGDEEGEREAGVPTGGAEDVPRQSRQVALSGSHRVERIRRRSWAPGSGLADGAEVLEDGLALLGVCDLRVPLDAVQVAVGVAHRFDVADVGGSGVGEPPRHLFHLVGVTRPDARLGGERPDERVVFVQDVDGHVGVAAVVAAADAAVEFGGDDLHPQTDAEHRYVEVEVVGAVADSVHVRTAREHDAVGV